MSKPAIDEVELLETAAAWFVRSRDQRDLEAASELEGWLAESGANREAFDQVSSGWATLAGLGSTPELITLRRNALDNASKAVRRRWRKPASRGWMVGAAACAAVAVLGALAYGYGIGVEQTYQTNVGERRTVALADGSEVALDGATRLSVRLGALRRSLKLLSGQAAFTVAKRPHRPFEVAAGDRTVVATGTRFNVDLVSSSLVVTLLEGHVSVIEPGADGSGALRAILMEPGQELVFDRGAPPQLRSNVDLDSAVAWTSGKLVFDNQPLSQAVERVNRHAARRVQLVDPNWTGVRFSGVFNAGDADAFVAGVTSQLPLYWRETPTGDIQLYAAAEGAKPGGR